MKKSRISMVIVVIILACSWSFARADNLFNKWKYYKDIVPAGNSKYKVVFLDEEVYRYAQPDLDDIRIVDEKGEILPYFILNNYSEEKHNSVTYESIKVDSFIKDNNTYIDFKVIPLKDNADILGTRLYFTVGDSIFLKNIGVLGSFDSVAWENVTTDSIYKTGSITKLDVALGGVKKYSYYRIKIPNNLEGIDLESLKVVHDGSYIDSNDFLRTAALRYDVKNEGKDTWITIFNDDRLKLECINLDIDGDFDRKYEIYDKNDSGSNYLGYSGDIYNQKFQDLMIRNTEIKFDNWPVSSQVVQIKIINNDDAPLDIKGISEVYQIDKLVFTGGLGSLRLYYGNPDEVKPKYDLENYKLYIEKENQSIYSLGSVIQSQVSSPDRLKWMNINYKAALNIIIALLSVLMLVLVFRKIKPGRARDS